VLRAYETLNPGLVQGGEKGICQKKESVSVVIFAKPNIRKIVILAWLIL